MTEREKKGAVVQVFSATQKRNENDGGQRGIKHDGEREHKEKPVRSAISTIKLRRCQHLHHPLNKCHVMLSYSDPAACSVHA